jgi:hypothetical protein
MVWDGIELRYQVRLNFHHYQPSTTPNWATYSKKANNSSQPCAIALYGMSTAIPNDAGGDLHVLIIGAGKLSRNPAIGFFPFT